MKYCNNERRENLKKKLKKSGEDGCLRLHWHRGDGGILQRIAALV